MSKNITILALIGVIILLTLLHISSCNKNNSNLDSKNNLIAALNDSLVVVKHRDSSSTATIATLKTATTNEFTRLQTKDSTVKQLQQVVNDYKGKLEAGSSVTNALIETIAELKSRKPPTIIEHDTVRLGGVMYLYPMYKDSIDNEWITVVSTMSKTEAKYDIKVRNDFTAVVGKDKNGPFVDLTLKNPYSETKQLRSYQVSTPRPKKWGLGINGSYGFNSNFERQTYIGVGLQYNFIRF